VIVLVDDLQVNGMLDNAAVLLDLRPRDLCHVPIQKREPALVRLHCPFRSRKLHNAERDHLQIHEQQERGVGTLLARKLAPAWACPLPLALADVLRLLRQCRERPKLGVSEGAVHLPVVAAVVTGLVQARATRGIVRGAQQIPTFPFTV